MSTMDGSGTTESNRAGGGLAEIGAMLRRRREEVGKDLASIAATTHIRLNYLKAIEDGHRRDLPGTAYMIGYIRTYADHLGFDGNRLITDFHAELAGQRNWEDKRAQAAEPVGGGLPQIQLSPAILMVALLVLGIGIYVAWGYFTAEDEVPVQTAAVGASQEPPASAAEPAAAPSPTGAEASAPPPVQPAPAAETAAEPAAEDQVPPETEVASTGEEAAEDAAAEPEPTPAEAGAKAGKIVVRARLESWIQVTNAKKDVVFSRVLRSGETYTVPDEKGMLLTTGNAGGIEILVNGKKLKSFGTVGLVKRDIVLDPKKLKDGSAFKATSRD
ncbi:MAG TPA: RodZ domain-containing protein [Dongiaceae bacterium]|nr:RodZ domain-containing protein [Dongiaceae bacterium]